MFESVAKAPPDAILGVTAAFRADPSPHKVDLGVGVYRDETGATPIPPAVLKAEAAVMAAQTTKAYLSPVGNAAFNAAMIDLVLGPAAAAMKERIAVVQTPGGSGALRMAAELVRFADPQTVLHLSTPTWANHSPLLGGAGLKLANYPYYDFATRGVDFAALMAALSRIPAGHLVVLHGSSHNPTGCDLTPAQWDEIAAVLRARRLVPLIDLAYQGLGDDLDGDAAATRQLAALLPEVLVAVSCSKNFGLYRDRVGVLIVVTQAKEQALAVASQFERLARTLYSMPPDHGAAIVACILGDRALKASWVGDVAAMTARIKDLRWQLAGALARRLNADFSWIAEGRGMFSLFGFGDEAMARLRAAHHVYLAPGGRMNIAGLHPSTVDVVADALAGELRGSP